MQVIYKKKIIFRNYSLNLNFRTSSEYTFLGKLYTFTYKRCCLVCINIYFRKSYLSSYCASFPIMANNASLPIPALPCSVRVSKHNLAMRRWSTPSKRPAATPVVLYQCRSAPFAQLPSWQKSITQTFGWAGWSLAMLAWFDVFL